VLLIGLGADEQLGGYGRHRTVFRRRGEAALAAELEMDVERLWRRNMGRDDRVTADAGRELLHPFLDEHVVAYLRALPLRFKCDLTAPPGTGDKLVLREAARWLGLRRAASLQKRAIQFGTRIANRKIGGEGAFDRGVDVAQVVNQRLIAD
jgi:asparagine synthetase B (glutamine-hydrolysing)